MSRVGRPVVGDLVVYLDSHHITTTYASTVAPYLYRDLLASPGFADGRRR